MLELRIISGAQTMPIFDLPAALGRSKAAREIGDTIEGLMAFLDDLSGDADFEDGGDDEPDGTGDGDVAWIERVDQSAHPKPIAREFAGRWGASIVQEDDEDNGDATDGNPSEDEFMTHRFGVSGPGCPISDPDKGAEDEGEPEYN